MKRLLAILVTLIAFSGLSTALAASTADLFSIESQFMCTSCHEPLNEVNSPQALSEKATLRALVSKGLTLSQLRKAMVAQYGPQVLARPPASGFNLTIYILPPAILVGGLLLLGFLLPKWRKRSREAAASPLPRAEPLAPAEAERLNEELEKFI